MNVDGALEEDSVAPYNEKRIAISTLGNVLRLFRWGTVDSVVFAALNVHTVRFSVLPPLAMDIVNKLAGVRCPSHRDVAYGSLLCGHCRKRSNF